MEPSSSNHHRSARLRAGNALVIALGVVSIVAALILVSSEGATRSLQQAGAGREQMRCLAALEAVLARREKRVIELAEDGDPSKFADWSNNYGLEYFGGCEVRWKVEPVRSSPKNSSGQNITFLTNPSPSQSWSTPSTIKLSDNTTSAWAANETVYLFRVAAEARICADDGSNKAIEGETLARAQGARYVSVNKEPLFRYVIFYAQKGPKGDLELSHGPGIKIFGNVHSNGSIYLGAGTETNDWNAVATGSFRKDTIIGPMEWTSTTTYAINDRVRYLDTGTGAYTYYYAKSGHSGKDPSSPSNSSYWGALSDSRARVTGVDGIFRLAKPAAYSFFNGFTMANASGMPSSASTDHYSISATDSTPLNTLDGALGTSLSDATYAFGFINPYRIKQASKLVTRPSTASATSDDRVCLINGNPVTGNWEDAAGKGNDARDLERTKKWLAHSPGLAPDGFSGYARTRLTGGQLKRLPETLASRPLEAQALKYPDVSTAATSSVTAKINRERGDEHWKALPVFLASDSGALTTTTYDTSLGSASRGVIESPGQYIYYALGETGRSFFRRNYGTATTFTGRDSSSASAHDIGGGTGFIGWKVTSANGTVLTYSDMPTKKVGLIIRERPVPDFRYFGLDPDGALLPDRTSASLDYLPYAYGKHKDASTWPFTEMFVSAMEDPGSTKPSDYNAKALHGMYLGKFFSNPLSEIARHDQAYLRNEADRGRCTITTAVRRGAWGDNAWDRNASQNGNTITDHVSVDPHGFYRDNWRFVNLKRVRGNITNVAGPVLNMTATNNYFNRNSFKAVQVDLVSDGSGRFLIPGDSAKPNFDPMAGLMVRPFNPADASVTTSVDLRSKALNGRDPFVALCFAPERGIVLQRRLERSAPYSVTINGVKEYFTGTGTSPKAYQTNPWGTDVVKLETTNPSAATYENTATTLTSGTVLGNTAYTNTTQNSRTDAKNNGTEVTLQSLLISTGESSYTRPSYKFIQGPWEKRGNYKFWKESKWYKYYKCTSPGAAGSCYWTLVNHTADYKQSMTAAPGDSSWWPNGWYDKISGNKIWILNPSGATPSSFDASNNVVNPLWSRNLKLSDDNNTSRFVDSTHYRIPWPQNGPGVDVFGGADTKKGTEDTTTHANFLEASHGNNTIIYTNKGDYATAKTWYQGIGLNEDTLKAHIKAAFSTVTTFQDLPGTIPPAVPSTPSEPAGLANPTTDPNPAAPTHPGNTAPTTLPEVLNPAWVGNTYGIAIIRNPSAASTYKRLELNAAISARGTWFPSGVGYQVTLPTGWPEYLTPNQVTLLPRTYSFPPTVWTGSNSPTIFPAATAATVTPLATWPPTWLATDAKTSIVYRTEGYNQDSGTPDLQATNGLAGATLTNPNAPVDPANRTWTNTSTGSTTPPLWEDTQIPRWHTGAAYVAASNPIRPSLVWYNGLIWQCQTSHTPTAGTQQPSDSNSDWARVERISLRIDKTKDGSNVDRGFTFKYMALKATETATTDAADWRWRTVGPAWTRGGDGMPTDTLADTDTPIPASWSSSLLAGLCVQSNAFLPDPTNLASRTDPLELECRDRTVKATFAGMRVETYPTSQGGTPDGADVTGPTAGTADNVVDYRDWEASVKPWQNSSSVLGDRTVNTLTSYLCSQYQVFFGPLEITEDFFSYTNNGSKLDQDRIATEQWFYNPRFFWSQSRWWNEGDLTSAGVPVIRNDWVEKETGLPISQATFANNTTQIGQREFMARTTVLDINMGILQNYIKNRLLRDATYRWSSNDQQGVPLTNSTKLVDRFSGLVYAARTNRYPRNPTPTADRNPWNPDLPNVNSSTSYDTNLIDLYDGLSGTTDSRKATANNYGISYTAVADKGLVRDRLVPASAANRAKFAAPIPWEDFHHGIMLSNANLINWGWVDGTTKFGTGKTSFVTPNSLYIRGNLNDTQLPYNYKGVNNTSKWTPLAIMGDNVTLLSSNWKFLNYQTPGIAVGTDKCSSFNTVPLNYVSGYPAATTSYRACILTNNQPTTKYRVFQGEGAPFVNTMLFLEDWGNLAKGTSVNTMNYTGSLVVLDSCRYTRSFLLQDARTVGRSPFGFMGWHNDNWEALTGWTGSSTPDWCKNASNVKMPPTSDPVNPALAPYGAPSVYYPPNRNMTFNDDLLTEEGTPPNTPFGVTASGVGGWTRVVQ